MKERELLQRVITGDDDGDFFLSHGLYKEIQELLAQPESLREDLREGLREGLREDLTREEISQGFRDNEDALNAESYWAGVEFAEKMHGVNNEISITK